jgi:hypothetical protein
MTDIPEIGILAKFVASDPGMAARLLEVHVDDGTGHCRVCSSGAQSGRYQHPCALWIGAAAASRLVAEGRQP